MGEKSALLSKQTVNRWQVIEQFEEGKLNRAQASELIEVSERQFTRLRKRFAELGSLGLEHRLKGKPAHNKTPPAIEVKIQDLLQNKYYGFSIVHAFEQMVKNDHLSASYDVIKRIAKEMGIIRVRKRRDSKIRKLRKRYPTKGFMLQMDGSEHRWFNGEVCTLISAIDDASSEIFYGEFCANEDLDTVLAVLRKIIEKQGIPSVLYVDRAKNFGWFKDDAATQFNRVCNELGIKVIYAHSAEGKGRIERAWKTLQDRLCSELRLHQIKDMKNATQYFNQTFLPETWEKKFTIVPKQPHTSFKPAPSSEHLNEIFCRKELRKIRRDHTLVWENEWYLIQSSLNTSLVGYFVEVRVYENGLWSVFYAGTKLEVEKAKGRRWNEFRENPRSWRKSKVEEISVYK